MDARTPALLGLLAHQKVAGLSTKWVVTQNPRYAGPAWPACHSIADMQAAHLLHDLFNSPSGLLWAAHGYPQHEHLA